MKRKKLIKFATNKNPTKTYDKTKSVYYLNKFKLENIQQNLTN